MTRTPYTQPSPDETRSLQQKIEALAAVADKLPVVFIVHCLNPQKVEYMTPNGLRILGCSLEQIKEMGYEYYETFFNREDMLDYVPKLFSWLAHAENDQLVSFFQQVRPSPEHEWKWYLTTNNVFLRDENGTPTHIISAASLVDPLQHVSSKANRLMEENNFLRRNQKIFVSLGKREKEILKCMALGESVAETAARLFISELTVNTHRRNIKAKLNAESNYDIVKFAQSFDLI